MGDLELRARRFAADAHGSTGQRRKYTGEPYIVHPIAVAEIVRFVPHSKEMIAAALLHDVVEDTPITAAEIFSEFGSFVGELVEWLTDVSKPSDGNRRARKHLDLLHTAQAPPAAKTVKLADLIDNSRTIEKHDPSFSRVYLREKMALLEVLEEGDATLWAMAARSVGRS